jgi:hypothetical protein
MDALINHCLKPVANTLPLATDKIKKLHSKRFFFKVDAMHAFWAISLDEESKKMLAFQTHELKVFSHGADSPWVVDLLVKYSKRHSKMQWTNICQGISPPDSNVR